MDGQQEMEWLIRAAVAKVCQCDAQGLSSETELDAIGLDSLGLQSVIEDLQRRFDIEFTPDQLMGFLRITTVGGIVGILREALGEGVSADAIM
jgi:acyl carrier protein